MMWRTERKQSVGPIAPYYSYSIDLFLFVKKEEENFDNCNGGAFGGVVYIPDEEHHDRLYKQVHLTSL